MIGINYIGQSGKLSGESLFSPTIHFTPFMKCICSLMDVLDEGCINDVQNMKRFLTERWGFQEGSENMVVLTDDQRDQNFVPTRRNIINAMRWLTGGVRFGDSLFFHFSGHGGQVKDLDGDEDDGYDETILPVDYKVAGQITDDVSTLLFLCSLLDGKWMLEMELIELLNLGIACNVGQTFAARRSIDGHF